MEETVTKETMSQCSQCTLTGQQNSFSSQSTPQQSQDALEKFKSEVSAFEGDFDKQATIYYKMANIVLHMRKFDEAITCCRTGLNIMRKTPNMKIVNKLLFTLAQIHHFNAKHLLRRSKEENGNKSLQLAIHYYQGHIQLCHQLNDMSSEVKSLGLLANVHHLLGNFKEAITYHEMYLQYIDDNDELSAQRRTCTNLGHAHHMIGKLDIATAYHSRALEIALRLKDPVIEAQCYFSLASVHLITQNYHESADNFKKHLDLSRHLGDKYGQCRAYWGLGKIFTILRKYQLALLCANEHLTLAEQIGEQHQVSIAKRNISHLLKIVTAKPQRVKGTIQRSQSTRIQYPDQ